MEVLGDIIVTNAVVRLRTDPAGALRPAVHACEVCLPNAGFTRIVEQVMAEPLDLGPATLSYDSARLIDDGIEVVVRARRGMLSQSVTARVRLSPAGNGQLRATIDDLRVGPFGAGWLLERTLGTATARPGVRQSGPRSVDLDIATLLREHNVPLDWEAGVDVVRATPDALVIVMT